MNRKLAVLFPGIGYRFDRPLLYESRKIAAKNGYEILEDGYSGFEKIGRIKGDPKKMQQAFMLAIEQSNVILDNVDWKSYERIVFISKSIGTAVAACYSTEHQIPADHIYYTPVDGTFRFMQDSSGIAFHGTADSWCHNDLVIEGCKQRHVPLMLIDGADHSLVTGDEAKDKENMQKIMAAAEAYLVR